MKYLLVRRCWLAVTGAATITGLLIPLMRPFAVRHPDSVTVFGLGVPLQVLVVGILLWSLSSRMEQFEFAGTRNLKMLRFTMCVLLAALGTTFATILGFAGHGLGFDPGTVGIWAALRGFAGLFGIGAGIAAFVDVRLAGLLVCPLVLVPVAFDTASWGPLGAATGFVLAPAGSVIAGWSPVAMLVLGITVFSLCYSERNAPSPNRRALRDARAAR